MRLSNTHKWTIAIATLLLIALLIWWLLRKHIPKVSPKPLEPSAGTSSPESSSPEGASKPSDDAIYLRKGSKGESVKVLQRYLNKTLQDRNKEFKVELLDIDGVFGAKTEGWLDILHEIKEITYGQYRTIENKMK